MLTYYTHQAYRCSTALLGATMTQAIHPLRDRFPSTAGAYSLTDPTYQTYRILHIGFIVAPIVAGADKFFHLLVNWDNYLAPVVNRALGGHGHAFMLLVGVIEIVAG